MAVAAGLCVSLTQGDAGESHLLCINEGIYQVLTILNWCLACHDFYPALNLEEPRFSVRANICSKEQGFFFFCFVSFFFSE